MPTFAHKNGLCYESSKATYITGGKKGKNNKGGRGFIDFSEYDWSIIPLSERKNTFILFDDHQDHLKRIKQAHNHNFSESYIFFDDNYLTYTNDCYSIKQIINKSANLYGFFNLILNGKPVIIYTDNNNSINKLITIEEHHANYDKLLELINYYKELHPIIIFYDDLLTFVNNSLLIPYPIIRNSYKPSISKDILKLNTQESLFESLDDLNTYMGYEVNKDIFYTKIIQNYETDSYLGVKDDILCKKKIFEYSFPCLIKLK